MPANSEARVNVQLGELLRTKHPGWRDGIGTEQSQVFREAARRPDIVVRHPGGQVVVVETEFAPGPGVESDACARLGAVVKETNGEVEQTVAVLLPEELKHDQRRLAERVAGAQYRYAVFSGAPEAPERWPESGWLSGGVDDLATCIEHASLSEKKVAEGARVLEEGVSQAAARLREQVAWRKTDTLDRIAATLHQEESEQTTRMAMAVVANALTFHNNIAGVHGVPGLDELRDHRGLSKTKLLDCWRFVLREINYWPIFKIASDLLLPIPVYMACHVMDRLESVAVRLATSGVAGTHDLLGQMFQRLIVDRKFLATFYTLPASATLLAELAVPRLKVEWGDAEAVSRLRIADLACGTGMLLQAAYQSVRMRHRHQGKDDAALHSAMMERALFAADIMPAATHLTASALSGAHPSVTFAGTRIATMPYGEQPSETGWPLSIGSLDLLAGDTARSVLGTGPGMQIDAFGTGRAQVRGKEEAGAGAEDADPHSVELAHESGDLLIMNPPFTRPTNHESATVPVPSFAGFDTSQAEQKAMSSKLAKLRKGLDSPAGAGNAGLASYFVDLAHVKTKPGGVIALVLPASFVQGGSWTAARALLERRYEDLVVVSIAASGSTDRAFSADTGMAEVLVVGTRKRNPDSPSGDTLFVNLLHRPRSLAEGGAVASAVCDLPTDRRSGRFRLGDLAEVGTFIRAPLAEGGCAGLREPALADAMLTLQKGVLTLPRTADRPAVPVTRLGELGRRGRLHRDISGKHPDGTPRGPFDIFVARDMPLYPVLWSHDAETERTMVVSPRQEGVVREGLEEQAAVIWQATATRLHFTLDFQLNSQSLAACLTPAKCIGGTAWPNFVAAKEEWEKPLTLWANSTLGLICFWWVGTRQQQGRARLTISRLPSLLALDLRHLSDAQLAEANRAFDRFRDRELLPANEAYRDLVRHELDRALLVDVLGLPAALLDPLAALRDAWCAEPTVHGGKTTRPGREPAKPRAESLPAQTGDVTNSG